MSCTANSGLRENDLELSRYGVEAFSPRNVTNVPMPFHVDVPQEQRDFEDLLAIRSELGFTAEVESHALEPGMPAPPYRRAFSASALKLFAECERKWFYRYLCNVIEDPGSSAATYGTAFHDALERFHILYIRPAEVKREELLATLDTFVIESFEKHAYAFDSALEAQLQCRRAQRTAVRYIDWLEKRGRLSPFEVIGNETHAPLDLDGFQFTGFIDRLDRDIASEGVTVVDYKTGNIAVTAAAYRDDIAAFREFQLPFYYWSRTAAGDRVTRLALIPLKDALLDVAPVELEIVPGYAAGSGNAKRGAIGVAELRAARERMISIARTMSVDTLSSFSTTDDVENCSYCVYAAACRARPLPCTDPFGR